jgi:hypothetical protein
VTGFENMVAKPVNVCSRCLGDIDPAWNKSRKIDDVGRGSEVHDADLFGTQFRPAEQPSPPTHGNHP